MSRQAGFPPSQGSRGINGIPAAEVAITPSLVQALLVDQHPDLARLPLAEAGGGWDNKLYRLGGDLAVRLPRRVLAARLIEHEQRWLPELAPKLPLPTPVPLRIGRPGCGFPWSWSVTSWLPGQPATIARPHDPLATALNLGAFLTALHQPAPIGAPQNAVRGVPLRDRTETVRGRVSQLEGLLDGPAVLALWDRLVEVPAWSGPPLWLHGDLHPGNLLVDGGRVAAVIDFGDITSGDPATDLSIAWTLLPRSARAVFRKSARKTDQSLDDDTWRRARGWALLFGLAFVATSRDSAVMASLGQATIAAVLADSD